MTKPPLLDVLADYSIRSVLIPKQRLYFLQRINGRILTKDDMGFEIPIGTITADKLFPILTLGEGEELNKEEFEDQLSDFLYDFKITQWTTEKEAETDEQPANDYGESLVLKYLEIKPEYRNEGIGRMVVMDLFNNFISGCGEFIYVENPPIVNADGDYETELSQSNLPAAFLEKIGFKPLEGSHSWHMPFDPENRKSILDI